MSFEILIPGKFIEPKDPILLAVGMEGWFTLRAIRNGQVVRERTFKNLILNYGMNGWGARSASHNFANFHVGRGSSTPAVTQYQLDSPVGASFAASGSASGATFNSGEPDYYSSRTYTGLSAIGAFGTVNLTEVGIGRTPSQGGELFSRALILDSSGNPVSFPIRDDEQLQISYELRIYPPLADSQFDVNVSGARTAIVRPLAASNASPWVPGNSSDSAVPGSGVSIGASSGNNSWFGGDLGLLTASTPQGVVVPSTAPVVTNEPYSEGSYKRRCRWNWSSTQANGSLRTHAQTWVVGKFQIQYDPPLEKTSDQTLFLDYELAWARR